MTATTTVSASVYVRSRAAASSMAYRVVSATGRRRRVTGRVGGAAAGYRRTHARNAHPPRARARAAWRLGNDNDDGRRVHDDPGEVIEKSVFLSRRRRAYCTVKLCNISDLSVCGSTDCKTRFRHGCSIVSPLRSYAFLWRSTKRNTCFIFVTTIVVRDRSSYWWTRLSTVRGPVESVTAW